MTALLLLVVVVASAPLVLDRRFLRVCHQLMAFLLALGSRGIYFRVRRRQTLLVLRTFR